MTLSSLPIFSFLPSFNWTLGDQSSALMWLSASVYISCWISSIVIFKIFICLITGQVKIGPPSPLLLKVLGGVILVDSCEFLQCQFLANSIMASSIKISLSLLSYLSFLHPTPSSFPHSSSSPHLFPFLPPISPRSQAQNFVRQS